MGRFYEKTVILFVVRQSSMGIVGTVGECIGSQGTSRLRKDGLGSVRQGSQGKARCGLVCCFQGLSVLAVLVS